MGAGQKEINRRLGKRLLLGSGITALHKASARASIRPKRIYRVLVIQP